MFCSATLLGSDEPNLVNFDLFHVCITIAWKHLNEKVPIESDKDKKRRAGEYHAKQMALSFEARKKIHGESLMEVLNPPIIDLICINIMSGILKIMSKVDPPIKPSKREDNRVELVTDKKS
jgi:hypothetical protein